MMSPADAFESLRHALEAAEIRFAVGGSWASTAFSEPRFTNDIDILAEFTKEKLKRFLDNLPDTFYSDFEEALSALQHGKSFNVIYMPIAFKFDFFPADAFKLGLEELERTIFLADTALSKSPVPYVTPEDILLAKLHWFRLGSDVSEVQWRDIKGIIRSRRDTLDLNYLQRSAAKLEVGDLLNKALE